MEIKAVQRTVYHVGTKHYFSLLGACRHRARIKIMGRLATYFEEQGRIDRKNAEQMEDCGYRTHEEFERKFEPSKYRYKQMRERLARTICCKMKRERKVNDREGYG